MSANLYIDTKGLSSIRVDLQSISKQIPGATTSAINRTIDFTNTKTVKEVTNEYTVKNRTVKATIKKVRARGNSLYAYISSTGPTISMGSFQHTPRNYSKKPKAVSVKIKKAGGYKVVKTTPKAFVQKIYGSESDIYMRKGSKRFPVIKLRSLSVPQMIANEKIMSNIQTAAKKKLQERINHEIEWRLNKAASKKRR
jgi:Prophage minor tail protein Z (GPZ)